MIFAEYYGSRVTSHKEHAYVVFASYLEKHKCKLRCVSTKTGDEMIALGDVVDGTLCSYDDQDDICIKGKCMVSSCTLRGTAATDILPWSTLKYIYEQKLDDVIK